MADGDKQLAPKDKEANTLEKYKQGNELFEARRYDSANKLYSEAISLGPVSADCYLSRATCYIQLKEYANALDDARSAVNIDPENVKAHEHIAKCCVGMGNLIDAEKAIQKVLELDPKNTVVVSEQHKVQQLDVLENFILSSYENKAYRSVVFYLSNAMKYAPDCFTYLLLKCECLAFLGRCDEALNIVKGFKKIDRSSAEVKYIRGICLYFQNNILESKLYFKRALRLNPQHERSKNMYETIKRLRKVDNSTDLYFKSGHYIEARDVCTAALKIVPITTETTSKLLYNRALANAKMGFVDNATADCTRALSFKAEHWKALVLRAYCHNYSKKFTESLKDYAAGLKLQKSPDIQKLLEEAQVTEEQLNRKDYYKILGISRYATDDEIKQAYREKAMLHDPNRYTNCCQEKDDEELKFKEISEAFAVLSVNYQRTHNDIKQD